MTSGPLTSSATDEAGCCSACRRSAEAGLEVEVHYRSRPFAFPGTGFGSFTASLCAACLPDAARLARMRGLHRTGDVAVAAAALLAGGATAAGAGSWAIVATAPAFVLSFVQYTRASILRNELTAPLRELLLTRIPRTREPVVWDITTG